jgi:hypothetical protein
MQFRKPFAFMAAWREPDLPELANAHAQDLTQCREEREGHRWVFTHQAYRRGCHAFRKPFAFMAPWREPDLGLRSAANAHAQDLTLCAHGVLA